MSTFLKEPLLHFLFAGTVLFAVYMWFNDGTAPDSKEERVVRITADQVEWLKQTWSRQWGRPPNEAEIQEIVAGYLKEELLGREARELKLDENDIVVRRRLAQKMEFMVQDTAQVVEPTEEELRALYWSQRERFQTPARITFTHVYFSLDRRGSRVEADALAALEQLSETAKWNVRDLGDRFLLQYDFIENDEKAVASVLGQEFARSVFTMETGSWQGPIESGYGLHLVRVIKKQPAQLPDFEKVKSDIVTLWRQNREQEARERYFAALLEKYDVVVDESVQSLVGPLLVAKEQ